MKRSTSYTIRVIIVVVLAVLTGRKEHHSRYHLDTCQQERFRREVVTLDQIRSQPLNE